MIRRIKLILLAAAAIFCGIFSHAQCGVCDANLGSSASTITVPAGQVWCAGDAGGFALSGTNIINGTLRICFTGFPTQLTMSGTVTVNGAGTIEFTDCPNFAPSISATLIDNADHPSTRDCDNACGGTDVISAASWTPSASASECNTVLPIELEYFRGSYKSGAVMLKWQSLTELNNDYYIIERSTDGFYFEEIVRVEGAGTSSEPIPYLTMDFSPHHPVSYYRLTQVDFDGRLKSFDIIAVETGVIPIGIYPNPTSRNFVIESSEESDMIKSSALVSADYELRIYSSTGELVFEESYEGSQHEVSMEPFPAGSYIVELKGNQGIFREKLIKL